MTQRSLFLPALLAQLLAGGPALGHAILTASNPALNATVPAGHRLLSFRYNSRIDHRRSSLVLTRPDRTTAVLKVRSGSAANALETEVDLSPGAYSLRWQALALDGHITRGDVPFTVTPPSAR